jgi:CRISPR-associated endoribonuclease Cas6
MIATFTFKNIITKGTVQITGFTGFISRGIFYEILKNMDPNLANNLHKIKKIAPYSTSPLVLETKNRVLTKNDIFTFTISLLTEDLIMKTREFLIKNNDLIIKVKDAEAQIINLTISVMDMKSIMNELTPITAFSVDFLTPTYFRQTLLKNPYDKTKNIRKKYYRYVPLPDPYLFFRSLARLWKKFVDININYKEYINWLLEGGIAIAGYTTLKTYRIFEHPTIPKWNVGFVGTVYYNTPRDTYDEKMAKITHVLLKFGEYSNVGGNRTAGFGKIKYKIKQEPQSNDKNP